MGLLVSLVVEGDRSSSLPSISEVFQKHASYIKEVLSSELAGPDFVFREALKWTTQLQEDVLTSLRNHPDATAKDYSTPISVSTQSGVTMLEVSGDPGHCVVSVFSLSGLIYLSSNLPETLVAHELLHCAQVNADFLLKVFGEDWELVCTSSRIEDMHASGVFGSSLGQNVIDGVILQVIILLSLVDLRLAWLVLSDHSFEDVSPTVIKSELGTLFALKGSGPLSAVLQLTWIPDTNTEEFHFDVHIETLEGSEFQLFADRHGYHQSLDSGDSSFFMLSNFLAMNSSMFSSLVSNDHRLSPDEHPSLKATGVKYTSPSLPLPKDCPPELASKQLPDQVISKGRSTSFPKPQPRKVRTDGLSNKWRDLYNMENILHTGRLNGMIKKNPSLDLHPQLFPKTTSKASTSPKQKSPVSRKVNSTVKLSANLLETSSSEEELHEEEFQVKSQADLPSEYWQIQKLVKYLKNGNQVATLIATISLMGFPLEQSVCQLAVIDSGCLDILVNLLETEDPKCKMAALKVLIRLSVNKKICRNVVGMNGLQFLIKLLDDRHIGVQALAAETIAHVAGSSAARKVIKQSSTVPKLLRLLAVSSMRSASELELRAACAGASALWACSSSDGVKRLIIRSGGILLLRNLLASTQESILIPVVGTLQAGASDPEFMSEICSHEIIPSVVKTMQSPNRELQMYCALVIFKCGREPSTVSVVLKNGGIERLGAVLRDSEEEGLVEAVAGALWMCAHDEPSVERMATQGTVNLLCRYLSSTSDKVLTNVTGAVGQCARLPLNRGLVRKAGGIPLLVGMLTLTNPQLLVNVTYAVGECAKDPDNLTMIEQLDGLRFLWSLLKSKNPEVQASAAWALCPCVAGNKNSAEVLRSFVGGLEMVVNLLSSSSVAVLTAVCALTAVVAQDEENLAVITDHGVVPCLAKITGQVDVGLRTRLSDAIFRCCSLVQNQQAFNREGAVASLVSYLDTTHEPLTLTTTTALAAFSKDPDCCIVMHDHGVTKPLVKLVGHSNGDIQRCAAACLHNIRQLANANITASALRR